MRKCMNVYIRKEQAADAGRIDEVVRAAFLEAPHTSHTEQYIVRALRAADALTISLVAETTDWIVAHVAVSPVSISGAPSNWFGLGPISVLPECQGLGIGSSLMRQALADLKSFGAAGCVLRGDPSFYGRFGFKPEPGLVLPNVPPEFFQALSFGSPIPCGIVSYHEAFSAQG